MSIIIMVSIVKGHHKWGALIMLAPSTFVRCVQFFQCHLEMEYTIMTVKVEQVPSQVSSCRTMVVEDNQSWSLLLSPPANQFHQSAIVETGCYQRQYPLEHE
jgi:hypothetical protein